LPSTCPLFSFTSHHLHMLFHSFPGWRFGFSSGYCIQTCAPQLHLTNFPVCLNPTLITDFLIRTVFPQEHLAEASPVSRSIIFSSYSSVKDSNNKAKAYFVYINNKLCFCQ
jgi:hypothetical protein